MKYVRNLEPIGIQYTLEQYTPTDDEGRGTYAMVCACCLQQLGRIYSKGGYCRACGGWVHIHGCVLDERTTYFHCTDCRDSGEL